MKIRRNLVKIMFAAAVIFTVCFTASYIWCLNFSESFYELLDTTLPFCILSILSTAGFGAAHYEYEAMRDECAEKAGRTAEDQKAEAKKRADRGSRYIIKTYDRRGVHKRRINVRGNYGTLRSA